MPECTPGTLLDLAKCFECLTSKQLEAIKAYLIAVRAGGSTDPGVLLDESKCFLCLTDSQLKAIQTKSLCTIANGGSGDCGSLSGDASPVGAVTPEFVGQLYNQNSGEAFFYSTGLTNADWTEITSGGGAGMLWLPATNTLTKIQVADRDLSNLFGGMTAPSFSGLQHITGTLDIELAASITQFDFPDLQTAGDVYIGGTMPNVSAVLMPNFQSSGNGFYINNCLLMVSMSLPALVSTGTGPLDFTFCTSLVNFSAPVWFPTNGQNVNFTNTSLSSASVDHVLARCVASAGYVSGTVNLVTGNSPGAQGQIDKAILIGRGCTVNTS